MNVQVRDIAMGNQHVLVLGDDNVVYALEWTPKRLCQEWKHVML